MLIRQKILFRLVVAYGRNFHLKNRYQLLSSNHLYSVYFAKNFLHHQNTPRPNAPNNHRKFKTSHRKPSDRSRASNDENRFYIYYGALFVSILFGFYIYDNWKHKFPRLFNTRLLSEDPKHGNMILNGPKNEVKKNEISSGKYSSMNFCADIVEQASPSVAFIQAQGHHPYLPMAMNVSSGSGFLVDKQDGIILTNAHVVANCPQVMVQFNDGRTVKGNVEFVDERLDLATVRLKPNDIEGLEPLPLCDSKKTRPGEWVIAVGSPFSLSNTVTVGVISSISRAGRDLGIRDNIEYIQTDASINIGNSGGPLLNLNGEAVGINTLKVGEGISFAIPAYYAGEFLEKCKQLRHQHSTSSWWNNRNEIDSRYYDQNNQEYQAPVPNRRVYLGFTIVTLTPHLIESHRERDPNFPTDIKSGVMIYRVVLGAPAHLSGLESGDIITAINGKPVQTADEVYRILEADNQQNQELEFTVIRGQKRLKLKVRPNITG